MCDSERMPALNAHGARLIFLRVTVLSSDLGRSARHRDQIHPGVQHVVRLPPSDGSDGAAF